MAQQKEQRIEGPTLPAALTEREAAVYLAVSPQFLRLSRHYGNRPGHGEGPPFIRLGGGRAIRYLKADLDAWLQVHRCHPTPFPTEN
jgi:predicted DNA-binding transcriptional regulator AlpA